MDSQIPALTARGSATRRRIVEAAAKLAYRQGCHGTSLDEVMAESKTSKSQLYHYFANKDALMRAVIELQTMNVMQGQRPHLERLDSMAALRRWANAIVQKNEQKSGIGGCPLGSLASELSEHSEATRELLMKSFKGWESHLLVGLQTMQERGELSAKVSASDLAIATLSALQGGILLAQNYRNARPVRLALGMAMRHIEHYLIKKTRHCGKTRSA